MDEVSNHATDKETGKAAHPGEWVGIIILFGVLALGILVTQEIQFQSNRGQHERLEAIEFQLSCPEHQRFVNVDDELFCVVNEEVELDE